MLAASPHPCSYGYHDELSVKGRGSLRYWMMPLFSSFRITGVGLAGLLIFFGACDQMVEPAEISVGVLLPLSGTLSIPGHSVKAGMDLAMEEINAAHLFQLQFIVRDTESSIENALTQYSSVVDDESVPVVIGLLTSSETERAIPLINGAKVVTISPTSAKIGLSAQSDFLFRSQITLDRVVPAGVRISRKHLNFTHVATMVNDEDAFSVDSHNFITQELGKYLDVTIVHESSFSRPQGDELGDVSAQLIAIRDAVPTPSAIFLSALPEGRIGVPVAAYRMGLRIPFIIPFVALEVIQAIDAAEPGAAEGIITFQAWLRDSSVPQSQAFVTGFQKRFGEEPGDLAARGYAAVSILGEALRNRTRYDSESIQQGLAGIRDFASILGLFSFDNHGDAVHSPVIAQVRSSQFVILSE